MITKITLGILVIGGIILGFVLPMNYGSLIGFIFSITVLALFFLKEKKILNALKLFFKTVEKTKVSFSDYNPRYPEIT